MKLRTLFFAVILVCLSGMVLRTTVTIEWLNQRAGNYLPRSDRTPEGGFLDGKWRRSSAGEDARDLLREEVLSHGLYQYLLAPLLFVLSGICMQCARERQEKLLGYFGVIVSSLAIVLMEYREYWSSLG